MFPVAHTIGTDFKPADAAAARDGHLLGDVGQPTPVSAPVPPLLRPRSSDEYAPVPWDAPPAPRAVAATAAARTRLERRPSYPATAAAIALRARSTRSAGGGFYPIPAEAEVDADGGRRTRSRRPVR